MSYEYSDYEDDGDSEMEPVDEEEEEETKFLTHSELETDMKSAIAEAHQILQVPHGIARILLHKFKWNKEALMDRFYDSPDTQAFLVNAQVIPKNQKGTVTQAQGECEICCDTGTLSGLACAHRACSGCWNAYLTEKILDARQCEIQCMASRCELLVDDEKISSYIDDPVVLEAHERQKVNSFVMCNPYMKWCPGKNCGRAVKTTSNTAQLIACPCGANFCFCCGNDWHEPLTCEYLKLWIKRCKDDSETCNWIMANTKECPKCQVTIEKNGGCNHMSCHNKGCKYDFCWLCMGDWKAHNSSGCNSFKDSEKEKSRETSKASLNRYLFYYNRFQAHGHSLKLEEKLKAQVALKMEQLQEPPVNLTSVEVKCLETAVETLSVCRVTLKHTYAFAFYLKKDNNSMLFEDNQKDLELATERLSGLLERDIIADLQEKIDFKQMINKVQDTSRYVEARRKILLEHCVEGYEKDFWVFNK